MLPLLRALVPVAALALAGCASERLDGPSPGESVTVTPDGAAGARAANDPQSPAYFERTVGDRVLFTVDQSSLDPEARATLDGQAAWLAENPDYSAIIEGHADERGTREYNLALGARRASAVEEYLISRGVAPSRLETVSYGKERPVAVCTEPSCYTRNRRAVTVVTAGPNA